MVFIFSFTQLFEKLYFDTIYVLFLIFPPNFALMLVNWFTSCVNKNFGILFICTEFIFRIFIYPVNYFLMLGGVILMKKKFPWFNTNGFHLTEHIVTVKALCGYWSRLANEMVHVESAPPLLLRNDIIWNITFIGKEKVKLSAEYLRFLQTDLNNEDLKIDLLMLSVIDM